MKKSEENKIGFVEVASIGIGGMVGGGIFAVLGLAVQLSKGGAPVAFLIAGIVALVTSYSYSKLSVALPSQGGTVSFIDKAFGPGLLTGSMNILLWISYIIMLSLYAFAFGSYGEELFGGGSNEFTKHLFISGIIILITLLNIFSAKLIGEAEDFIVAIKLIILLFFCAIGFWGIQGDKLSISQWSPAMDLVAGGFIIFLAYEGFELIANTASDVREPEKTLPRAFYASVIFVIGLYILVAAVTVGNLPVDKIVEAKDYALAIAAKPFLGQFGIILISVAALLSTTSAINATLYGSARLSYIIAKDGELPKFLEKNIWNKPLEGLIITSVVTLLVANLFDLSSLSTMGSAGFLLIFACVNLANAKLSKSTSSKKIISYLGVGLCLGALASLIWQTLKTNPSHIWILFGMVILSIGIEGGFRLFSDRNLNISKND
ncbi:MAG TPA: APC family permease [Ignavibacteriaceae bacterium]|nr:APC family permease [Ignavibacteriaceae bacterium]